MTAINLFHRKKSVFLSLIRVFLRNRSGRVGSCFSALLSRSIGLRYGSFVRALKNSELTSGGMHVISGGLDTWIRAMTAAYEPS